MTTFPALVIAEYERTKNPIIGRALDKAQWSLWDERGDYWKPGDPASKLDSATHKSHHIDGTNVRLGDGDDQPYLAQSLAYCLLAELAKANVAIALVNLVYDNGPDCILAACTAAHEGRE